jgi:hypothetical protein
VDVFASMPRAFARNLPFLIGAATAHAGAYAFFYWLGQDPRSGSRWASLLLQLLLVTAGLVALGRSARAARSTRAQAVEAVVGALAAMLIAGVLSMLSAGLLVVAVATLPSGGMVTEGVLMVVAVLMTVVAWMVVVGASPVGAAAHEPARQLQVEEAVRSQRWAVVMSTLSFLIATALPGQPETAGWPALFVPLAAAVGAAAGLFRARAVPLGA